MTYPLVRELAEDGIAVSVTCRVLKFSSQGYYQWLKTPCSKRDYDCELTPIVHESAL